ncbi:glycosyltransferase [candidate division KSB1 bacterium]|nr:glycosyltransferase [candidate division KSB1 bacterium]
MNSHSTNTSIEVIEPQIKLKPNSGIKLSTAVSIVIPAYNESEAIGNVLDTLLQGSEELNVEIIVVNDGSNDATSEIVKQFPVRLINHDRNIGYGAALKTGIQNSQGSHVLICDADSQHRVDDIIKMIKLTNQYDVIISKRIKGSHQKRDRIIGKFIIKSIANLLTGIRIPDINSGLRAFKKSIILKYLHLLPNGFSASTTSTLIMLERGYRIHWLPIHTMPRVGKSSVKQFRHGSQTILLITRMITLFNPMKIFLPISFMLGAFGVIWSAIFWRGGFSTLGSLCLLSSITIFFFGILCDHLSQLRLERFEAFVDKETIK